MAINRYRQESISGDMVMPVQHTYGEWVRWEHLAKLAKTAAAVVAAHEAGIQPKQAWVDYIKLTQKEIDSLT